MRAFHLWIEKIKIMTMHTMHACPLLAAAAADAAAAVVFPSPRWWRGGREGRKGVVGTAG